MASEMLERVSGLSYENLARKTLTDDLGMSVHIGWRNSIGIDQPWGHTIAKGKVEPFPPDYDYKLPFLSMPAGTFFCRSIIVPDSGSSFTIMTNAGSGAGPMESVVWLTMRIVKEHVN
jgi:CubicO group peptidase (beta-lactamase class C family)